MLMNLFRVFTVLKQGECLLHAATWKNAQVATTAVGAILVFVAPFIPGLHLSSDDILDLAKAVVVIVGVVNGYLTVATSPKVGLPTEPVKLPVADGLSGEKLSVSAKSSANAGSKGLTGV